MGSLLNATLVALVLSSQAQASVTSVNSVIMQQKSAPAIVVPLPRPRPAGEKLEYESQPLTDAN